MPCFNQARFLEDSVGAILRQSHADLELMIVDDCSSDNSWDIIRRLADGDSRIRPIRHERNLGASRSRNDGLRAATGDFIGFCDADDVWEPMKLEIQIGQLRNNPNYDVVYCDTTIVDERGLLTGRRFSDRFRPPRSPSGSLFRKLIRRNFINMQSVVMRRECLQVAGYFDEGIKWVEDWWYWVRLSRQCRFLYSNEPLARYRVHSRSTNVVQKRGYHVNRFRVLTRILQGYPDLPLCAKADVIFNMGAALCELGKYRFGRRLYWQAVQLSIADVRAVVTCCRAFRRLILHTGSCSPGRVFPQLVV